MHVVEGQRGSAMQVDAAFEALLAAAGTQGYESDRRAPQAPLGRD